MLGKKDFTPMIAVKDLDRARAFYEDTLGLKTVDTMGEEVVSMKSWRQPDRRLPLRICRDQQGDRA